MCVHVQSMCNESRNWIEAPAHIQTSRVEKRMSGNEGRNIISLRPTTQQDGGASFCSFIHFDEVKGKRRWNLWNENSKALWILQRYDSRIGMMNISRWDGIWTDSNNQCCRCSCSAVVKIKKEQEIFVFVRKKQNAKWKSRWNNKQVLFYVRWVVGGIIFSL